MHERSGAGDASSSSRRSSRVPEQSQLATRAPRAPAVTAMTIAWYSSSSCRRSAAGGSALLLTATRYSWPLISTTSSLQPTLMERIASPWSAMTLTSAWMTAMKPGATHGTRQAMHEAGERHVRATHNHARACVRAFAAALATDAWRARWVRVLATAAAAAPASACSSPCRLYTGLPAAVNTNTCRRCACHADHASSHAGLAGLPLLLQYAKGQQDEQ